MNPMNWVGASGRRLSVVALAGLVLALAAGALALFAALGYRTGALDLGTSFSFLRWGARTGLAALGVSLVGLVLTVLRGRGGPLDDLAPGVGVGVLALAIGAGSYAIPAQQQSIARSVPPIHDITTDMENPPEFVDVLPLRADAPNPPEYDPEIASQQREGYPDLGPIILDDPPAAVFERALAAVHALGWDLVGDDADAGRIEATDTTFWYGFKDDVVVRIRPDGSGSRVDVRSKSRVGGSDVGANAARIQTFAERLTAG